MGDGTQNVKRYRYFFLYQIFSIPIPVLFPIPVPRPSCCIFLYVLYIFEGLFTWYGTSLDNQKFAVEVAINESNGRTVKASVALHLYDGRPAEWRH